MTYVGKCFFFKLLNCLKWEEVTRATLNYRPLLMALTSD